MTIELIECAALKGWTTTVAAALTASAKATASLAEALRAKAEGLDDD